MGDISVLNHHNLSYTWLKNEQVQLEVSVTWKGLPADCKLDRLTKTLFMLIPRTQATVVNWINVKFWPSKLQSHT